MIPRIVRANPARAGTNGKLGVEGDPPPVVGRTDMLPPVDLLLDGVPAPYVPPTVGDEPIAGDPLLYEPSTVGLDAGVPVVDGDL
jgi:hypothetical protein